MSHDACGLLSRDKEEADGLKLESGLGGYCDETGLNGVNRKASVEGGSGRGKFRVPAGSGSRSRRVIAGNL